MEPIFDTSPTKGESRGEFSEGPELAGSMRTRSFSFSSISNMSASPEVGRDEEFSSFRKDDDDDEELFRAPPSPPLEIPKPQSRSRRGSWDGFVSLFHGPAKLPKEEPPFVIEEAKNRNVDTFRPYLPFLQTPYDEAAYRALMKPPLGGLATIISRDLKRMNSLS